MAPRISPEDVVWAHAGGELCFQRGTVVRLDPHKGTVSVRIKSGIIDAKEADVHKTNSDKQDGVPDNTYLRELNEATLLHNVQYRYDSGDDGGRLRAWLSRCCTTQQLQSKHDGAGGHSAYLTPSGARRF